VANWSALDIASQDVASAEAIIQALKNMANTGIEDR
jgi:hypothetical protein